MFPRIVYWPQCPMTTVNACSYNQLFHDAENSSVVGKLLYEKAFIISWIYNSQVNIEKKLWEKTRPRQISWTKLLKESPFAPFWMNEKDWGQLEMQRSRSAALTKNTCAAIGVTLFCRIVSSCLVCECGWLGLFRFFNGELWALEALWRQPNAEWSCVFLQPPSVP